MDYVFVTHANMASVLWVIGDARQRARAREAVPEYSFERLSLVVGGGGLARQWRGKAAQRVHLPVRVDWLARRGAAVGAIFSFFRAALQVPSIITLPTDRISTNS
jgi:hypothetical protein